MYFKTRQEARNFANRSSNVTFVDCGSSSPFGRRWLAKLNRVA